MYALITSWCTTDKNCQIKTSLVLKALLKQILPVFVVNLFLNFYIFNIALIIFLPPPAGLW